MSTLHLFNPKGPLVWLEKDILAVGTTMHHLNAQSKIGDYPRGKINLVQSSVTPPQTRIMPELVI
jgi:hypothetical protein